MSITHKPKSGSKLTGTEYEADDAHVLALVDADIPASIARDSEVTSAIAALSTVYQPLDSDLTAIAALTTTTFGRSLLALADAAAARTSLGLGSAATLDTDDFDAAGAADAAQAAAEAASQPLDSDLTAIAALATTSFGRALLTLADAAALLSAAGAEASGTAASAVATHAADTTDVHGIADTADLVLTDDSRLTDARTPTAHASTHEDGGTDEISLAGLSGTSAALQAHLDDTADAHDASAISLDPGGLTNTDATDVQGAVADLDAAISAGGSSSGLGVIQTAAHGDSDGAMTITLGTAPTNGNWLLLLGTLGNAEISTISQTGVTWTKLTSVADGGQMSGCIWIGVVGSGASTSITTTGGGSTGFCGVFEMPAAIPVPSSVLHSSHGNVTGPAGLAGIATTKGNLVVGVARSTTSSTPNGVLLPGATGQVLSPASTNCGRGVVGISNGGTVDFMCAAGWAAGGLLAEIA